MSVDDPSTDFIVQAFGALRNVDFSKIDKDATRELLKNYAPMLSKQAFELAGKGMSHLLTLVEMGGAYSGQWYMSGLAFLTDQALNFAEQEFENYMGWDENPSGFTRGEWVIATVSERSTISGAN